MSIIVHLCLHMLFGPVPPPITSGSSVVGWYRNGLGLELDLGLKIGRGRGRGRELKCRDVPVLKRRGGTQLVRNYYLSLRIFSIVIKRLCLCLFVYYVLGH